ncbi:glycoside hydrolase family 13 protein [Phanerochaete carnosa HHB-10118-sp]|uniref:alpha-amylase n=1 Tax=Phanerochaete carnosa (strain HHB-10118-sp) TaxID=650164 RepID=K5WR43_PHACS|nr:glycoside hydrolase family 13 protein [Phanerochaete carnosa HHB-10118-sp]EKM52807.1 glycoside hydrolase family 13 protein [Phanerochaete carnosa HHB-10118-sp]
MRAVTLVSTLLAVPAAFAATASDWQGRSIYQFITDRFATSDGSSPPCDTSQGQYCGGTWQGAISKLDYIQNMGFDAIWISPVVKNLEGNTSYGEAFHGYWTQDPTQLNSHFGSASDLNALSDALHKRGMYLMVDIVINHLAAPTNPPQYTSLYSAPFNTESSFHTECWINATDYPTPPWNPGNQTRVEQCWLGDTNVPLADINTEDPNLVQFWYNWVANMTKTYSVDGYRIDTAKHIRQDFWTEFQASAGVWCVGEVLANQTEYVGPYTKFLPAVLDYPTWYPLVSGFMNPQGNLSALVDTVQQTQSTYGNGSYSGSVIASFLENQDQPRFGGQTSDQALIKNAMAWPFVQDGIPIMYYGQEQGYTGGADPANREALWLSGYETDKPLVQHAQALNAARKAAASANSNFYNTSLKFIESSASQIVASKPPLLALLTNQGSSSSPQWTVSSAGYQPNEDLVDVVSCTKVTADSNGGVSATAQGGNPMVLVPASALNKSGSVCQSLATGSGNGNSTSSGNQSSSAKISAGLHWTSIIATIGAAAFIAKLVA